MDYRFARLWTWWLTSQGAKNVKFEDVLEALTTFARDADEDRQANAKKIMNRIIDAAGAAGIKVIHRKHGE